MRGAVAAGHPLTAEAGAQVLAEGGNAVDACIAAAFVSWVAESTLTGTGRGRLHARASRARQLDPRARPLRHRARARPQRARPDAHGQRRDRLHSRVVAVLPDRGRLVRRPGSGGRARRSPSPLRLAALANAARAGDRARPRRGRADRGPGVPARHPRPDPAPHRRGQRDVQRERQPPGRRRPVRALRPRADARAARRARGGRPLPRRAGAGALEPPARARRRDHAPRPERLPRHPQAAGARLLHRATSSARTRRPRPAAS